MRRRSKVGGKTGSARSCETATSKRSIARKTVPGRRSATTDESKTAEVQPKIDTAQLQRLVRHIGYVDLRTDFF